MTPNEHESQSSKNLQYTPSSCSTSSYSDEDSPVRDRSPLKKSRSRNNSQQSIHDTKILPTPSTKRSRKNERIGLIPKDQSSTASVSVRKQKKFYSKLNKEVSGNRVSKNCDVRKHRPSLSVGF
ncbi:uncharacterized protein LOC143894263 [Temnothorax americanus]|uniref:uncharacterized protein LOC143894263 n=1 Tax=Temnothorax americanus TaxID=1964332 RepID=UPI00406776CF